jgi:co-chaperonin GroES (HSP10)
MRKMMGAKMKPLNRRLLIEVLNQEEEQSGVFFVPKTEKTPDEYTVGSVVACAEDCTLDLVGKKVFFTTFGMETVVHNGHEYIFIGENHLICSE